VSLRKIALLLLLSLLPPLVFAQKVVVSGTVTDVNNGEQITGAYIILTDTTNPSNPLGCVSNKAGFYSISVYPGCYRLKVSFMGYEDYEEVLLCRPTKRSILHWCQ